jgi:hypothetical protein
MNSVHRGYGDGAVLHEISAEKVGDRREYESAHRAEGLSVPQRSILIRWLLHDMPFVAMLLLALTGLALRFPIIYWIYLMPVFAVISIVEGWRHFGTPKEKLGLIGSVAAIWCALLLSTYILFDNGVTGVLNANAIALAMLTLLALGTFVAGLQARAWRVCAVGGALFVAAPGLGWLDQSPMLLVTIACLIMALAGLSWWFRHGGRSVLASGRSSG